MPPAAAQNFGNIISGGGAVTVASGQLAFGAQTYSGPTNVTGGTLTMNANLSPNSTSPSAAAQSGWAMPPTAATRPSPRRQWFAGGRLTTPANVTADGLSALTLAGGTLSTGGNPGGSSWRLNGPVNVTQNSTIDGVNIALFNSNAMFTIAANATLNVTGALTQVGGYANNLTLTAASSGTMILAGASNISGDQWWSTAGRCSLAMAQAAMEPNASIVNNSCVVFAPGGGASSATSSAAAAP